MSYRIEESMTTRESTMAATLDLHNIITGALPLLSRQIGATSHATAKAASLSMSLLVGTLFRKATKPTGADRLLETLDRAGQIHPDDRLLAEFVDESRRGGATIAIAAHSGVDENGVTRLLEVLAPLIIEKLGEARQAALQPPRANQHIDP